MVCLDSVTTMPRPDPGLVRCHDGPASTDSTGSMPAHEYLVLHWQLAAAFVLMCVGHSPVARIC